MPAATDLIMSTLPPARAGVGSAVNDTVREVGGALGVAVIGSVAATTYASNLQGRLDRIGGVPDELRAVITDNVGAAVEATNHLGANGAEVASAAREAFVSSMSGSLWVGVGLAAMGALITVVHLPNRAAQSDDGQEGTIDEAALPVLAGPI